MNHATLFKQKAHFFDRWASFYDCSLTTIFYQAIHQRFLDYVQLPSSARVLDLGCGTGKFLGRLAKRFPDLWGTGLDLSPEMLHQARQANQYHPRLIFVEGNAEQLPFGDRQFNAVFNSISFLHYPDPQRVFQEVARVLKPQGYFYLADFDYHSARIPFSPGGLRFYNPEQRQGLADNVGLVCLGHHALLGPVLGSIFQKV